MEMTKEFSRVCNCFHEGIWLALSENKRPVKALFGPWEFGVWKQVINSNPHNTDKVLKGYDDFCFDGVPIRRMAHPGVAVVTKDLPVIEIGTFK